MPILRTPPLPAQMRRDIWAQLGWAPHSLQREVLLDPTRQKLVAAGRRAGKSAVGGHYLIPEAFRAMGELSQLKDIGHRREYWIVGPEYSDAEKEFRVVWDGLTRLGFSMDRPGSYNNPHSGEMRIQLFGGRFIVEGKSAKYPGTLVGEGLSGVVFSEAAKLKPSVYHKFLRPTLADFVGWVFMGSTPEGRNWFYDLYEAGQDPAKTSWRSWRAPSWCNPNVYEQGVDERALKQMMDLRAESRTDVEAALWFALREVIDPEILSLFDDMSSEMFNQEVACLFTEYVGRVFKDFDEEYHVNDQEWRPDWTTYGAYDEGFTNPSVFLIVQVDPHMERVHVLGEYYEVGKTPEDVAREVKARGLIKPGMRGFFPDPAGPAAARTISEALRIPVLNPGSLGIQDRLEWMRRKLKLFPNPDLPASIGTSTSFQVPYLTIHRRCVQTRREFNLYRYKETFETAQERGQHAPENPEKKNDHTPEALGRLFSGLFGSPWRQRQARQTRAKVGSGKRRR